MLHSRTDMSLVQQFTRARYNNPFCDEIGLLSVVHSGIIHTNLGLGEAT